MGGSVSSGRTNDELIDNLIESNLIRTQLIERVFRCIDRGLYYLPNSKESAYRDLAWRDGPIHISAPCIYTRVMENLELKENLSFLNIGSGTGYLSSMVGLILGPNGINHNIEIHKELIDYAKQKTIEFVNTSLMFDDFDYCVPKFVHGNCMNLKVTTDMLLYDRIYVGAGVTSAEESFFSSLLKVNGILIMPLNDSLVKIKRIDEQTFFKKSIMTVSFASLITTTNTSQPNEPFHMPNLNPLSLQELCRYKIRQTLRKTIENEDSEYYKIKREKSTFNSKLKVNYEENESSDEESTTSDRDEEDENERNEDFPLTRFQRLFRNRHISHISNVHENNMNFENQLRLMIYGHILDAAVNTTSNTIAIRNDNSINDNNNYSNQINDDTDQDDEEEDNNNNDDDDDDDDDMQIINSDQLFSAASALMEVTETVEHESEVEERKATTNLIESSSNESNLNNLASSIESIENNLSEKENSESSSISSSISNSNHLACSIPRSSSNVLAIGYTTTKHSIPIRRKRQVSSGYQSTSTDFSSSLNENNNNTNSNKMSSDESNLNEKKNESETDSDHYFDDENDDDNDYKIVDKKNDQENENNQPIEQTEEEGEEPEDNNRIYAISQILQASAAASAAKKNVSKVVLRRNLLRDKIMMLPISGGLKQFLLYYRKI